MDKIRELEELEEIVKKRNEKHYEALGTLKNIGSNVKKLASRVPEDIRQDFDVDLERLNDIEYFNELQEKGRLLKNRLEDKVQATIDRYKEELND